MNKKYLLLLSILLFVGCSDPTPPQKVSKKRRPVTTQEIFLDGYKTIVKDSCEYLIWMGYNGPDLVHKGNCKYCQARKCK